MKYTEIQLMYNHLLGEFYPDIRFSGVDRDPDGISLEPFSNWVYVPEGEDLEPHLEDLKTHMINFRKKIIENYQKEILALEKVAMSPVLSSKAATWFPYSRPIEGTRVKCFIGDQEVFGTGSHLAHRGGGVIKLDNGETIDSNSEKFQWEIVI